MDIKQKILVVDDEKAIRYFISATLQANGYDVITAVTAKEATEMISSHCPDVVLLDLGLPDTDGITVLESVRKWSPTMPIIIVSARDDEAEKVKCFECGADDYITKPFGTSELLARIRVAIRHANATGGGTTANSTFEVGDLIIDYNKYRVYIGGKDAELTQSEFKLISLLGRNAGKVLTYAELIRYMWGPNAKNDNQILRVNMANIRRKIEENPAEPRYIFTEVGVGYRMAEE